MFTSSSQLLHFQNWDGRGARQLQSGGPAAAAPAESAPPAASAPPYGPQRPPAPETPLLPQAVWPGLPPVSPHRGHAASKGRISTPPLLLPQVYRHLQMSSTSAGAHAQDPRQSKRPLLPEQQCLPTFHCPHGHPPQGPAVTAAPNRRLRCVLGEVCTPSLGRSPPAAPPPARDAQPGRSTASALPNCRAMMDLRTMRLTGRAHLGRNRKAFSFGGLKPEAATPARGGGSS